MAFESENNLRLEIGHVLFIDIVGYSKLLIEEQKERLGQLTEIVLASSQVAKSTDEQLVRLPTGDGMALVFRRSAEEPARCALEIAEGLRKYLEIPVRMGIHSGPVSEVIDVSGRTNLAGAGINMAQRVMDCGDAGHILLSKRVADDLEAYRHWASHLYSLGECEVKHGVRLQLVNLYSDDLGNPETPQKLLQAKEKADAERAAADNGFWVAVLPFKYGGNNADVTTLVEGLNEEIVTGLSLFSYLKVISRGSTVRYANESVDIRAAGKELGARYVMEGSVRQAGTRLRFAVQLVDAVSGAHLWAESYERPFSPETFFELQDDLVPRIVATVADHHGVLVRSMSKSLLNKASEQLSPYEAVLRSFGYFDRITPDEHAAVRVGLERAVQQAPGYADAWAMLSIIYCDEFKFGFNARPDPLGRALEAARRATDAAPSDHFAYLAIAQALFYRKEFPAFRSAAERAIALNPMDSGTTAYMGSLMSYAGDWDRGSVLVKRAMELNPKHPGWYWFALFYDAYRKRDYRAALEVALKINMPGFYGTPLVAAAACGQLGERDGAGRALRELLGLWPDVALSARAELGKHLEPGLLEHVVDGLRQAGLEVATEETSHRSSTKATKLKNGRPSQTAKPKRPPADI